MWYEKKNYFFKINKFQKQIKIVMMYNLLAIDNGSCAYFTHLTLQNLSFKFTLLTKKIKLRFTLLTKKRLRYRI